MVARLAGPPLKWYLREGLAATAILIPIALIVLGGLVSRSQQLAVVPVEGTVRSLFVSYASKYGPTVWIDIDMPDGRRNSVASPDMRLLGCRPGDRIYLLANRVRRGVRLVGVDPKGCSQPNG